jgi:SAM-dependent methyltransferase
MSANKTSMYDVERHIAEIYDRQEDYVDDIQLISNLIAGEKSLRILEPFCGTGRILLPLVLAGHRGVGIDRAKVMLDRAREKASQFPRTVRDRLKLVRADVLAKSWPRDFGLVILGGNCLYELATAEEQEKCVARASRSLNPGGHLFLDNNHMEGHLSESWQRRDKDEKAFPTGECEDGTIVQTTRERIWYDIEMRLVKYRRRTIVSFSDGNTLAQEYEMQCHPPSTAEMRIWLEKYGFEVQALYGDRSGNKYDNSSNRAIFWAKKS